VTFPDLTVISTWTGPHRVSADEPVYVLLPEAVDELDVVELPLDAPESPLDTIAVSELVEGPLVDV
jgi:hypothetical protein